jgi:hypothetical protein
LESVVVNEKTSNGGSQNIPGIFEGSVDSKDRAFPLHEVADEEGHGHDGKESGACSLEQANQDEPLRRKDEVES